MEKKNSKYLSTLGNIVFIQDLCIAANPKNQEF